MSQTSQNLVVNSFSFKLQNSSHMQTELQPKSSSLLTRGRKSKSTSEKCDNHAGCVVTFLNQLPSSPKNKCYANAQQIYIHTQMHIHIYCTYTYTCVHTHIHTWQLGHCDHFQGDQCDLREKWGHGGEDILAFYSKP